MQSFIASAALNSMDPAAGLFADKVIGEGGTFFGNQQDCNDVAQQSWQVYNFEVAEHHTYVADGVRVHNTSAPTFFTQEELLNAEYLSVSDDGTVAVLRSRNVVTGVEKTITVTQGGQNVEVSETETVIVDESGLIRYTKEIREKDGTGGFEHTRIEERKFTGRIVGEDVAEALGTIFSRALLDENDSALKTIAVDTLLFSVLEQLGADLGHRTSLANNTDLSELKIQESIKSAYSHAFNTFGGRLVENGTDAIITVVQQLIFAELVSGGKFKSFGQKLALGYTNAAVDLLVREGAAALLSTGTAQNFLSNVGFSEGIVEGLSGRVSSLKDGSTIGDTLHPANILPTLVLGQLLPAIETKEGSAAQVLTSVVLTHVAAANAFVTNAAHYLGNLLNVSHLTLANPIVFLIGWAVGKAFDALFKEEPQAYQYVRFNADTQRYELTSEALAVDGGNLEFAKSLAESYVYSMNGVLDTFDARSHDIVDHPDAKVAFGHFEDVLVHDVFQIEQQEYQARGDTYTRPIKVLHEAGREHGFDNAQKLYLKAILDAIENATIRDGNAPAAKIYANLDIPKMRQELGDEETMQSVMSQLQIASEYRKYLENEDEINRLIAEEPTSAFSAGWVVLLNTVDQLGLNQDYTLIGDHVDNQYFTASGDDHVQGSVNNDLIKTFSGDDTLEGGVGDDTLDGGSGADSLFGGRGSDTYVISSRYSNSTIRDQDAQTIGDATQPNPDGIDKVLFSSIFNRERIDFDFDGSTFKASWSTDKQNNGEDSLQTIEAVNVEEVAFSIADPNSSTPLTANIAEDPDILSIPVANMKQGTIGVNTLSGTSGNDYLELAATDATTTRRYNGSGGDDLYVYRKDMGTVEIVGEAATTLSTLEHNPGDRVLIADLPFNEVEITRSGEFLNISWTDGDKSGALKIADNGDHIEKILFASPGLRDTEDASGSRIVSPVAIENYGQIGVSNGSNNGTAHNDFLIGTSGEDTFEGADGADTLLGAEDSDRLYGGDGDDVLWAGESKGNLFGHDTLEGGLGDDILYGVNGSNWLYGDNNTNSVTGGDVSADTTVGGDDTLIGGDDWVTADVDWLYGGAGNDLLISGQTLAPKNATYQRDGGDQLFGGTGDDTLIGGTADDSLVGEQGDDLLSGGKGSDTLRGGAGFDIASYSDAETAVRVHLANQGTNSGEATGDEFAGIDGIRGSRFNDTLNGSSAHDRLEGGPGDDQLFGLGGGDLLIAGAGSTFQRLQGGHGNDIYSVSADSGRVVTSAVHEVASEGASDGNQDVIRFDGIAIQDVTFGSASVAGQGGYLSIHWDVEGLTGSYDISDGGEYIELLDFGDNNIFHRVNLNFRNTGNVRLVATNFDDELRTATRQDVITYGDAGNDLIVGGTGRDSIEGGIGDDTLDAGTAADASQIELLEGGSGNDTYRITREAQYVGIGADQATFVGAQDPFNESEDPQETFTDTLLMEQFDISDIQFSVNDYSSGSQGLSSDWGNALTLSWRASDDDVEDRKVVVAQMGHNGIIDRFVFADGIEGERVIVGTSSNNSLTGASKHEILVGKEGNDTIFGQGGNDVLLGGIGRDELWGGAGNDTLDPGTNSSSGWQFLHGESGNDTYYIRREGLGKVIIDDASGEKDTVVFEDLKLSDVSFTYHDYGESKPWKRTLEVRWGADDQSVVRLALDGSQIERFVFADGSQLGSIQADFGGIGDRQELRGTLESEYIHGTDQSEYIFAGEGDDTIDAGGSSGSSQIVYGENGNDTFYYSKSDGLVLFHEAAAETGGNTDTMIFTDLAPEDLTFTLFNYATTSNADHAWGRAIRANWEDGQGNSNYIFLTNEGKGFENLVFQGGENGETTTLSSIVAEADYDNRLTLADAEGEIVGLYASQQRDKLYGTSADDTIIGTAADDLIYGGDGNDVLNAGESNGEWQILQGDKGNDTYVYQTESRRVHIFETGTLEIDGTADRIEFSDLNYDEVQIDTYLHNDEEHLRFLWDSNGNGVTEIGTDAAYLSVSNAGRNIEEFVFANRDVYVLSDFGSFGSSENDTLTGDQYDNKIHGLAGNDLLLGEAGNDTLQGGLGHDEIRADDGDDLVYGGKHNDILDGGHGNDTLWAATSSSNMYGSDTLYGGDGNDSLLGSNGRDSLYGDDGNDTLTGGRDYSTADVDHLYGGSGNDLLESGQKSTPSSSRQINGDLLYGQAGNDTLVGGKANDRLEGGSGADLFVFANSFGQDSIYGFEAGLAGEKIDLSAVSSITSYSDLTSNHLSQSGGNTVISDGTNKITLIGLSIASLGTDDFLI